MVLTQKLKNFFVFRRDNTQEVLKSGEAYQLTRQGGVVTSADNAAPAVDPATGQYNTNVLEVLGSRGDPRQLEALYRNMTNLYTNGATRGDAFHEEALPSLQRTTSRSVLMYEDLVYDLNVASRIVSFKFKGSSGHSSAELQGSHDGTGWKTIAQGGAYFTDEPIIPVGGEPSYRYIRWVRPRGSSAGHSITTYVESPDTSRFLRREEQDKLKKKVADPYNIHLFIEGGLKANDTLLTFVAPRDLELPKAMEGTVLHCGQWPAYNYTLIFAIDSVVAGTILVQPSGVTTPSVSKAVTIPKGAKLRLYTTQVADPQLADLAITLSLKRIT